MIPYLVLRAFSVSFESPFVKLQIRPSPRGRIGCCRNLVLERSVRGCEAWCHMAMFWVYIGAHILVFVLFAFIRDSGLAEILTGMEPISYSATFHRL